MHIGCVAVDTLLYADSVLYTRLLSGVLIRVEDLAWVARASSAGPARVLGFGVWVLRLHCHVLHLLPLAKPLPRGCERVHACSLVSVPGVLGKLHAQFLEKLYMHACAAPSQPERVRGNTSRGRGLAAFGPVPGGGFTTAPPPRLPWLCLYVNWGAWPTE